MLVGGCFRRGYSIPTGLSIWIDDKCQRSDMLVVYGNGPNI